jgi:hypothetical protein
VVASDSEEPAASILYSEAGGKTLCCKKISGLAVFITVFRYDRVFTVLLLKFVNPRLEICSTCWALEQNPSVVPCFHMVTFIKLIII